MYFWISSEETYQDYQENPETKAIVNYREEEAFYKSSSYSLGGGGLALTVIGTISAFTTPDRQKLEERYKSLMNKITRMEEQLQ